MDKHFISREIDWETGARTSSYYMGTSGGSKGKGEVGRGTVVFVCPAGFSFFCDFFLFYLKYKGVGRPPPPQAPP